MWPLPVTARPGSGDAGGVSRPGVEGAPEEEETPPPPPSPVPTDERQLFPDQPPVDFDAPGH
eukprot:gene7358-27047_t